MIKVKKLSEKYLKEASFLANSVFRDEDVLPGVPFKASLDQEKFEEFNKIAKYEYSSLEYFVAVDETEKVLGTTGLYSRREDEKDTDWLGWYCVDPKFRGKGIGSKLLDYTIRKAKERGKKFLRLYTSMSPKEKAAQRVYNSRGFRTFRTETNEHSKYETIYKVLVL